eukprot:TRINITY_DN3891_c0_g1_i9.p1 TRINITY_DN3891_c0_g1~~TRINITY_DN3891_c0_g1_i9.p1  ORF type:complete len:124 (-),score=36.90 TRINITY_DN3891_c0_g1_i9:40-411(-)
MFIFFFFLMIRRPPRSTQGVSSAASDVYKRQVKNCKPEDFKGSSSHAQITVVELEKGAYGVAVTNWNDKKSFSNIVVNFAELGLPKNKYNVRDLWKHIDMGEFNGQFTVALLESHHTQAFLLK